MTIAQFLTVICGSGFASLVVALWLALAGKRKAEMEINPLKAKITELEQSLAKENERSKDEIARLHVYHDEEKKRYQDEVRRLYDLGIRMRAVSGSLSDAAFAEMKRSPLYKETKQSPDV